MESGEPSQEQPELPCQRRGPAGGSLEGKLRLMTLVKGTWVGLLFSPRNWGEGPNMSLVGGTWRGICHCVCLRKQQRWDQTEMGTPAYSFHLLDLG